MKYTFAYWGNYTIAFKTLFEKLGIDFVPPEKTSPRAIEKGAKIAPELYCFPLKVNIGNYLIAIKNGAKKILMVENVGGSCRQRYYGIVQNKVLKDAGYDTDVVVLKTSPKDIYLKIKNISDASLLQIFRAIRFAFKKLRLIEKLEKMANFLRPREKEKGKTNKILRWALDKIDRVKEEEEFSRIRKEILKKISEIEIDENKKLPRVGIIGEIYTVCDDAINFGIEEKLAREEVEVHREMNLTYHLKKGVFPWKEWWIQKKIMPYLKSTVGGHGRDAIYEMLNFAKEGFNGVIQLLPFGCMPETTVRPILEKIHQKTGIPFLSLSLDEQVAETGIQTRIEAFSEVVKAHFEKNNKSKI